MPIITNLPVSQTVTIGDGGGSLEFTVLPSSNLVFHVKSNGYFNANIAIQGPVGLMYGVYNVCGFARDQFHIQKIQEGSLNTFSITQSSPDLIVSNKSADATIHVGVYPILGGSNITVPSYPDLMFGGGGNNRKEGLILSGSKLRVKPFENPTDNLFQIHMWLCWDRPTGNAPIDCLYGEYYYYGIENDVSTFRGTAIVDTLITKYYAVSITIPVPGESLFEVIPLQNITGVVYVMSTITGRSPEVEILPL